MGKAAAPKVIDGVSFPAAWPELFCHLWLFRFSPKLVADPFWRPEGCIDPNPSPQAYTGTGRFSHSTNLSRLLMPAHELHDWSLAADQAFCENEQVAICGGGGSSKSTSAGNYAFKFWACAPNNTAVLVASTSIDAARKRVWKNIGGFYTEACRLYGGLGQSTMIGNPKPHIRSSPKDMAHGMFVIPVAQGDTQKAIDQLKGFHPARLLIIGDETDAISQAIVDVCSNLRIGTVEFQAIWLGNLPSSLNPLGKLMEPAPGKPVTASLGKEWTSSKGLKCLRFDGEQSPNIRDRDKWTGIIRQKDIDAIARDNGGTNTPGYWIMVKGLPPPDGVEDTVCSESILHKFNCFEPVTWKSGFISSGMLDPGFGGDPCIFRTMKRGLDSDGKFRVLLDEVIPIPIQIDNSGKNPADYQIADKVQSFCKARGIAPDEFIADTTGIGRGVGSILQREWSPQIHLCEFGGSPSTMIVSEEDPRPAKEVYDRQVTELWFSIREFVEADMLRGLDQATAIQLCQRKYEIKGRRKSIQKKEEMPKSPNEADALACGIRLLRSKGINATIQTPAKLHATNLLDEEARSQDFDSHATYMDDYELV